MKKEEIIKQEWVSLYGEEKYNLIKYAIKENGYIDCVKNPEISKIINAIQKGICWGTTDYMPSNLKGIFSNNGWIKIESEEDLPKEDCDVWCIIGNSVHLRRFHLNTKNWWILYISHYQPIVRPLLPIY
jgi:hypothetical protein